MLNALYTCDKHRMREALLSWARWLVLRHCKFAARARAAGHIANVLMGKVGGVGSDLNQRDSGCVVGLLNLFWPTRSVWENVSSAM